MVSVARDAWLGGPCSFVYMLICVNEGKYLVKLGVSDVPMKRLDTLRTQCPFKPKTFALLRVPTRKEAFIIEAALLSALCNWKTRGEWLQFSPADKPKFNEIYRRVLSPHRKTGYAMQWQQIRLAEHERVKQARGANFRRRYATQGAAYRNFLADRCK